jgi:dTDP-4-dehydrorhamnose 3,5-epimerase
MPFEFESSGLAEVVVVQPRRFPDGRGWFQEAFKASEFRRHGLPADFVQDNLSCSAKGTLRGIHFQTGDHAQGKLVQVLAGAVWDVAVDLRRHSPTFGKWFGVELSGENRKMLYIPPGFGHGFVALQDQTLFSYKCTAEYSQASEGGIVWNDPDLAIRWPVTDMLVSPKDAALPPMAKAAL